MQHLANQHVRWTTTALNTLPYDEWNSYEIIDGTLFVWEPPHCYHQDVSFRITKALNDWAEPQDLGLANFRVGIVFSETDTVIPDVVWISHKRLAALLNEDGHLTGAPELVVEVLSPGLQHELRDREAKLRLYEKYIVWEYWIVDWQLQQICVYRWDRGTLRLDATLLAGDELTSPLLPGLVCPVARLFA